MKEDTQNPGPIAPSLPLSLLGEVLVASRKEQGITQQELAARLGMLQEAVARMEREKYRGVGLERMVRVEQALGLRVMVDAQAVGDPAS